MGHEHLNQPKPPITPPPRQSAKPPNAGGVPRPSAPSNQPVPPQGAGKPRPFIQTEDSPEPKRTQVRRGSHSHGPEIAPPGQGLTNKRDLAALKEAERVLRAATEEAEQADEDMEDLGPIDHLMEVVVEDGPSWLVSTVVHIALILILALVVIQLRKEKEVPVEAVWSERIGDTSIEFDDSPMLDLESVFDEAIISNAFEIPVLDPFAEPPPVTEITPNAPTASFLDPQPAPPGFAPDGVEEGAREQMIRAGGGNRTTEEAVKLALAWLARNQKPDGSWSLLGPYPNGGRSENKIAATAMALLAFQGHRDTTVGGEYRENVRRGWEWMLEQQSPNGQFFGGGMPYNHTYYTHAQATIAICELLHMSHDETYREPAEKAVQFLLRDQSPLGGWRYSPSADSDVSVTGWCVMALQSARMAEIEVPEDNMNQITNFLDRVASENGSKYSYQIGQKATRIMTAEGLLCREYLGWQSNNEHLVAGADYLVQPENLVSYAGGSRDAYYWYYATQTLHHIGGEHWSRWNRVMRQELPFNQTKTGQQSGSWDPYRPSEDLWAEEGGRLYVTCLSTYCLEIYYRHMPLYWNVYTVLPTLDAPSVPTFRDPEDEDDE